ncbi:MAG: class II glutamine amidotransferase, partial [Sphingomonadales bacterium]|nr:class II glutamine amidotransferase [Sphingomonadales bacterium]
VRELWGCNWTFAHNGKLPSVKKRPLGHFQPVGTTDSEHAFCWMMDQIRRTFPTPPRSRRALAAKVQTLSDKIASHGTFNMLLSDSRALFAYNTTKLSYLTRRAPFGSANLIDDDLEIDFCKETTPNDIVTVIATSPLTID